MIKTFLDGRVIVKVGDLTTETVDAIVNAANSSLFGGGGVDGAIHRAGGQQILAECRAIRKSEYPDGLPPGKAVITTGGRLAAPHVIHTLGPIYGSSGGREAEVLADCYLNSIDLAAANGLSSIAFPSISTGAFGYPRDEAAAVASSAIKAYFRSGPELKQVRLVFFSAADAEIFIDHCRF